MNRLPSLPVSALPTARHCHKLLSTSRVRRQHTAEDLENRWRELRRHATIEKNPEKMLRLAQELDCRNRRAAAITKSDED
jgi:hypothetical protein